MPTVQNTAVVKNQSTEVSTLDINLGKMETLKKPMIDYPNLKFYVHAKKRVKERFGIQESGVENWIKQKLSACNYYGVVTDSTNKESKLFASSSVSIHLTMDLSEVITVIPNGAKSYLVYEEETQVDGKGTSNSIELNNIGISFPLQSKIVKLYQKELISLERKRLTTEKGFTKFVLKQNIVLAELELKLHRARASKQKAFLESQIEVVKKSIENYRNVLDKIGKEKNQVAKALSTLIRQQKL